MASYLSTDQYNSFHGANLLDELADQAHAQVNATLAPTDVPTSSDSLTNPLGASSPDLAAAGQPAANSPAATEPAPAPPPVSPVPPAASSTLPPMSDTPTLTAPAGMQQPPGPIGNPPPTGDFNAALAWGKQQIDKPYIWGSAGGRSDLSGTAPGYDCSGFVSEFYHQMGRSVPAQTLSAYNATQHVDAKDAQPGDIVEWMDPGHDATQEHMAIYLGNGQILQSGGSAHKVNIGSLNQFGATYEFRRPAGGPATSDTTATHQLATAARAPDAVAPTPPGSGNPLDQITSAAHARVDDLLNTAGQAKDATGDVLQGATDAAHQKINDLLAAAPDVASAAGRGVGGAIGGLGGPVSEQIGENIGSQVPGAIGNFLTQPQPWMQNVVGAQTKEMQAGAGISPNEPGQQQLSPTEQYAQARGIATGLTQAVVPEDLLARAATTGAGSLANSAAALEAFAKSRQSGQAEVNAAAGGLPGLLEKLSGYTPEEQAGLNAFASKMTAAGQKPEDIGQVIQEWMAENPPAAAAARAPTSETPAVPSTAPEVPPAPPAEAAPPAPVQSAREAWQQQVAAASPQTGRPYPRSSILERAGNDTGVVPPADVPPAPPGTPPPPGAVPPPPPNAPQMAWQAFGEAKSTLYGLSNFHPAVIAYNTTTSPAGPGAAGQFIKAYLDSTFKGLPGVKGTYAQDLLSGPLKDAYEAAKAAGVIRKGINPEVGSTGSVLTPAQQQVARVVGSGVLSGAGEYEQAKISGASDEDAFTRALVVGGAAAILGPTAGQRMREALWNDAVPLVKTLVFKAATNGGVADSEAAQFVNNTAGGQNLEKILGAAGARVASVFLQAPDWLASQLKYINAGAVGTAKTALDPGSLRSLWPGQQVTSKVLTGNQQLSRDSLLKQLVIGSVLTEGLQYAFTHHFTDENTPGKQFVLEVPSPAGGNTTYSLYPGNIQGELDLLANRDPGRFLENRAGIVGTVGNIAANEQYPGSSKKVWTPGSNPLQQTAESARYALGRYGSIGLLNPIQQFQQGAPVPAIAASVLAGLRVSHDTGRVSGGVSAPAPARNAGSRATGRAPTTSRRSGR